MKYQISLRDQNLDIEYQAGTIRVGHDDHKVEVLQSSHDTAIIKMNNKIFTIRLSNADPESKSYRVSVNGKSVQALLKTETDLLVEKMGGGSAGSSSTRLLKAPMPGLIVKLHVSIGDQLEKGQPVLNFEAMKMENQLKSPGAGIIKNILVAPGSKVEKGQLLVEME